jgi:hypothetical protein
VEPRRPRRALGPRPGPGRAQPRVHLDQQRGGAAGYVRADARCTTRSRRSWACS